MKLNRARISLIALTGVIFVTPFLMAQVGPTVFTPRLTVSPGPLTVSTGDTTVQDLIIQGTCTGCTTTSPGGANTQVQYNNSGAFGGDAGFTYNAATDTATVTNIVGNGSGLTNLDAGDIATGTLAVARGGTGVTTSTGAGSTVRSADPALTGIVTVNGNLVGFGTSAEDEDGTAFTGFSSGPTSACVITVVTSGPSDNETIHSVQFGGSAGACQGTSNAATMTFVISDNAPYCYKSDFLAVRDAIVLVPVIDNGTTQLGQVTIGQTAGSACTWTFGATVGASGGFTASGTKGIPSGTVIVF